MSMTPIPAPPRPVFRVAGSERTYANGDRLVQYLDAAGNRYACVSDGARRAWYAFSPPAGEYQKPNPSQE